MYKAILTVSFIIFYIGLSLSQLRFTDEFGGRFKGFTKSNTEHIMNEYEGVPELRSVRGVVTDTTGIGLPDVLFELRKDDPNDVVRGTLTDTKGEFHLKSIPDGVYMFKVTKDCFQSVYGKLKVRSEASSSNTLKIKLNYGV